MTDSCRCKLCGETAVPRYRLPETVVCACPRCDLHFIPYHDEPATSGDDIAGAMLGDGDRRYIEERLPASEADLPSRIHLLQRYLHLNGAYCLDIGTGLGQFLRRLAAAGAQGYGIEPSPLRRQFAREKFALDLFPEPVESRRWQESFGNFFDAITLWEVIEHVNDPSTTLRGAWTLLKPEGLLFIETPSRSVPAYRLSEWCYRLSRGQFPLFLGNFYAPIPFGHKQIFTPAQLAATVAGHGFELLLQTSAYPDDPIRPLLPGKNKIIVVARKRPR